MTPEFEPTTQTELARFLAENAAGPKQPIQPLGGRTALHFGFPPAVNSVTVSLAKLSRVVDYPARDMTITVEAGIRIDDLAEMLRAEGQQLPIDVAQSNRATLGGAVATNTSGPRRFSYGTLRDYVIGVTAISAPGRTFHSGGRVVKNVAGYDLCKLLVGSLGTLAVITQLTLKLKPIPPAFAVLWVACPDDAGVEQLLESLQRSETRPVILDAFTPAAAQAIATEARLNLPVEQPVLLIGVQGTERETSWQVETLKSEIAAAAGSSTVEVETAKGDSAERLRKAITEFAVESDDPLTFRASLPPSRIVEFLTRAERAGVTVAAHAGNGIAIGHLSDETSNAEQAAAVIAPLREFAREHHGHLAILNCDDSWKHALSVFGEGNDATALMRRVKSALDPDGLLNPGRFIDHEPARQSAASS